MDYHYYNQKITLNKLEIEGVYNVNNTPSDTPSVPSQTRQRKRVNSLYGFANFSWNDTYYLDITGRNDWSSALAPGNWSYFYPLYLPAFCWTRCSNSTSQLLGSTC